MILEVGHLREYTAAMQASIEEINSSYVAVTADDLSKLMNDHGAEMNTLLLSLIPDHDVTGEPEAAQWENTVGFYLLEKTTYSDITYSERLDIFARTQRVAVKVVNKLLEDKYNNTGLFCGFLAFLVEKSVTVSPVVGLNGCNGYYIQFALLSNL